VSRYTKASFDLGAERGLLTFLHQDLELTCQGLGLARIPSGEGWSFWHTHQRQEEVYVGLQGTATILVDDEAIELGPGDFLRVSPEAKRAVGNRSPQVAVVLITGAMPHEGFRANPEGRSLISDGVPDRESPAPDWTVA
jgi:mannose-6-phosphate isomerase-like protein (cupin superfamily)